MTLVKWSPFREMEAMQSEMNRLFSRFGGFNPDQFNNDPTQKSPYHDSQWMLSVDIIETPDALKLKASLPGVDAKDVDIQVDGNLLTLSAQRRREEEVEEGSYHWVEQQYGTFSRSLSLPRGVDTEKIEASYNNGILELKVPKKESSTPRKIALSTQTSESRVLEAGSSPQTPPQQLESQESAA